MCTGCVQSGLEFAAAGSVVVVAGLHRAGLRARDRIRPEAAADRRARREAEAAAFLEGLDLDARAVLGSGPRQAAAETAEELQPA